MNKEEFYDKSLDYQKFLRHRAAVVVGLIIFALFLLVFSLFGVGYVPPLILAMALASWVLYRLALIFVGQVKILIYYYEEPRWDGEL